MTIIIGFKAGSRLPGKNAVLALSVVLMACLAGCSGEVEKSASVPGSLVEASSSRPDDDVLTVLGVTASKADSDPQSSGLRIEVHEPKFDEHKPDKPEPTPPPRRASPLDF